MDESTKEESMNERIKELREQAADFASQTYSKYTMATFDTNKSIETLFEEKFAELIVKECAKFLDENSGSDQCNNVWYPTPEEMLQHFGVDGMSTEDKKTLIKELLGVKA
jgi:hypothetical protein